MSREGDCRLQVNTIQMSQDSDDEEFFSKMMEEEKKEMTDIMIQLQKDMMIEFKGTEWGDQAAFELFQSLYGEADLPEPDVPLPFNPKTRTVTLMWTKPKAARIDILISADRPEATVNLEKPAVSYEEALDKLKKYFA